MPTRNCGQQYVKATHLWFSAHLQLEVLGLPMVDCPLLASPLVRPFHVLIQELEIAKDAAVNDNQHRTESSCSKFIKDALRCSVGNERWWYRCSDSDQAARELSVLNLQLQFCDESATEWRWMRQRHGSVASGGTPPAAEVLASTSATYVPQAADIGCWLRVECTPAAPHFEEGLPVCGIPYARLWALQADQEAFLLCRRSSCCHDDTCCVQGRRGHNRTYFIASGYEPFAVYSSKRDTALLTWRLRCVHQALF